MAGKPLSRTPPVTADKEFLVWVAHRLVSYGDNPQVDFIGKLCSIANCIPDEQDTMNLGPTHIQQMELNRTAALHELKPRPR